jgi:hypothetical protein
MTSHSESRWIVIDLLRFLAKLGLKSIPESLPTQQLNNYGHKHFISDLNK